MNTTQVLLAIGGAIGALTSSLTATLTVVAAKTDDPGWYMAAGFMVAIGAAATAFLAQVRPQAPPVPPVPPPPL